MKDFELLPHNLSAYDALCKMLEEKGHAAVIQATGTGKGYIAMQLIKDNPDKHILFVTSYKANLTHFMTSLEEFSIPVTNVTFTVYPSLSFASENCPFDIIITDEFHRLGAPGFWKNFKAVLERSPSARLVGFSATPVRHLDNPRDMSQELFNGDVAWELPLDDAILDGLLPAPDYITAAYSFEEDIAKAEKRLEDNGYSDNAKAKELVEKARRTLQNAGGLRKVFEDRLANRHGKYIVFCRSWEHMKTMMELVDDWFDFCLERHVYRLYSDFRNHKDLDGFASDDSDALKLLFSIDMLNEGVHLAGIDGVIMLRPTQSPNVYFQQLGRALSVTSSKVPQVFDIVDNFAGMNVASSFWTTLSQRARSEEKQFVGRFEVAASQVELMDVIRMLEEMRMSWDDWYVLACQYAAEHGSLAGLRSRETYNGKSLGSWVFNQKAIRYRTKRLAAGRERKLEELGISWSRTFDEKWEERFQMALSCKDNPDNLTRAWLATQRKQVKRGKLDADKAKRLEDAGFMLSHEEAQKKAWNAKYEEARRWREAEGAGCWVAGRMQCNRPLANWIHTQQAQERKGALRQDRKNLLDEIGVFESTGMEFKVWMTHFQALETYVEEHGRLPEYREKGASGIRLRPWFVQNLGYLKDGILPKRKAEIFASLLPYAPEEDELTQRWNAMYEQLAIFKQKHGRLPRNGEVDDRLYRWVSNNRSRLEKGTLTEERAKKFSTLLDDVKTPKMRDDETWLARFNEVCSFVTKTGSLTFPHNGGRTDSLRNWLGHNKIALKEGKLPAWKAEMLSSLLDKVLSPSEANDKLFFSHCDELREYIRKHGKLPTRYGDHDKLGKWVENYRQKMRKGKLSPERERAFRDVLAMVP